MDIDDNQLRILKALAAWKAEPPPSQTELAGKARVPLGSLGALLERLCAAGLIERQARKSRSVQITNKGLRVVNGTR